LPRGSQRCADAASDEGLGRVDIAEAFLAALLEEINCPTDAGTEGAHSQASPAGPKAGQRWRCGSDLAGIGVGLDVFGLLLLVGVEAQRIRDFGPSLGPQIAARQGPRDGPYAAERSAGYPTKRTANSATSGL
jgi:hypothetical protein